MMSRWYCLVVALLLLGARAFSTPPKSDNVRCLCKLQSTLTSDKEVSIPSRATSNEEDEQIRQILVGKHKWLGGALDSDSDTIYGIPSQSNYVICLSPPPSTTTTRKENLHDDKESSDSSSYQINMLRLPSYITNNAKMTEANTKIINSNGYGGSSPITLYTVYLHGQRMVY